MKITHNYVVVSHQDTRGNEVNICSHCVDRFKTKIQAWPKNWAGEEFSTVSRGAHYGKCHFADGPENRPHTKVEMAAYRVAVANGEAS